MIKELAAIRQPPLNRNQTHTHTHTHDDYINNACTPTQINNKHAADFGISQIILKLIISLTKNKFASRQSNRESKYKRRLCASFNIQGKAKNVHNGLILKGTLYFCVGLLLLCSIWQQLS